MWHIGRNERNNTNLGRGHTGINHPVDRAHLHHRKLMKKYPKIRPVGHREITSLFHGPVIVQEKIDGSNFAFGKTRGGKIFCLSRERVLSLTDPNKQFGLAVHHVLSIAHKIPDGYLFRAEFLSKNKHNILEYKRTPKGNLVLFDIEMELMSGAYSTLNLSELERAGWAEKLEIDLVPVLHTGDMRMETVEGWLSMWAERESLLGGQIEGVVIKNYNRFTIEGEVQIGKLVRKEFKEIHNHKKTSEKSEPAHDIGASRGGPARWRKAVQWCRDNGALSGDMADMPLILQRVREDVEAEDVEAIKDLLWIHYRKNVLGATTKGLSDWYKSELGLL
jgi:hypothetical protein